MWYSRNRFLEGQDVAKLLSRSKKATRDGIQVSEPITGDGAAIFCHACWMNLEGIVSKRIGSRYVSGRTRGWLKTKNRDFRRSQLRRPGRLRRQSPEFTYSGMPAHAAWEFFKDPIAPVNPRLTKSAQFTN